MSSSTDNIELNKKSIEELLSADPKIQQIQNRLVEVFLPLQMYLFGSHVYGTTHDDSDYDFLLVVKETAASRAENMMKAREALFDLDVVADVFVYSEQEFNDWKNELNSVAEAAYNLGVELSLGKS